jgi:hypothetical protein
MYQQKFHTNKLTTNWLVGMWGIEWPIFDLQRLSKKQWSPVLSPDLGTKHSRTLLRIPPPHVLVHTVHSDHSFQKGQSWMLHFSFSSSFPKQSLLSTFPDKRSTHCRSLRRWPVAHVLEHEVQSPHGLHSRRKRK